MAHTVEEYKRVNERAVYDLLSRFASDNQHASSVETRWLATQVETFNRTVARVMNCRLDPEEVERVNAFLANEIELELAKKRSELAALERDLKKVQPGKAA